MDGQQHGQARGDREHMFEKPLTPSDVGKLNRLVIPKQHAERHFPLGSASRGEKKLPGLLLSFEDEETGKAWVFRYSYWTSSQSYVLTKGWSRFVKEKHLDAGDTVLFERTRYHRAAGGSARDYVDRLYIGCRRRRLSSDDAGDNATTPPAAAACRASMPTGNTRRLRLFGVNLECGTEQPAEPERFVPASCCQFMPTNASNPQL